MQILKEILKKSKSREALFILLILLFGTLSFGLGKISKIEDQKSSVALLANKDLIEDITVEKITLDGKKLVASPISATKKDVSDQNKNSGVVIASKTGKKYHFPWCTGAKSIKEDNKIWFNSIDDARKAGYTPAQNCKGLK